jgi:3-deoxy-manno-octulosonate cytidylyltransferase (CMP-KDO synthetase)
MSINFATQQKISISNFRYFGHVKIVGIIPSRYASTRFPGKPLVDIKGKTMIQRVYEQALKSEKLSAVVVATDDERIKENVLSFGGNVVMTNPELPSGTDRCFAALQQLDESYDAIINIQGDEPYIFPEQIDQLAGCFNDGTVQLATLVQASSDQTLISDPNKVKVALAVNNNALMFSRSPIPYLRDAKHPHQFYLHVGIYGYTANALQAITQLPPSSLEKAESLEQLRWLENGYSIRVAHTEYPSVGIDTLADLERLLRS